MTEQQAERLIKAVGNGFFWIAWSIFTGFMFQTNCEHTTMPSGELRVHVVP
jgi:hypothetical protein